MTPSHHKSASQEVDPDRTRMTSHILRAPITPLKLGHHKGTKSRVGEKSVSGADERDHAESKSRRGRDSVSGADKRNRSRTSSRGRRDSASPMKSGTMRRLSQQRSRRRSTSRSPEKKASRSRSHRNDDPFLVTPTTNRARKKTLQGNAHAFAHDVMTMTKLKLPATDDFEPGMQQRIQERVASFHARKVSTVRSFQSNELKSFDQNGVATKLRGAHNPQRNVIVVRFIKDHLLFTKRSHFNALERRS